MSLDHYIETEDFKTSRPKLTTIRRLFEDLFEERFLFGLGFLFVILGTIATLAEPQLFGLAIDDAVVPKNADKLFQFACVYFGVVSFRVVCVTLQGFLFEKLSQRMMQRLRMKLFETMHSFPLRTFDRTPVGRLITRLTNDTGSMNEMFSAGFITLVGNFLFILGTIVWMLVLNWKLALIGLSSFPILLYCSAVFSRKLVQYYRDARMRMSSLNAFLAENILGMKVVQLFSQEAEHLAKFSETNQAHYVSQISSIRVYAVFQPLITWCSGFGMALVIYFGGKDVYAGEVTPGTLVTFIGFLMALFQPLREFVDRWTIFLSGMSSAERIYAVLDWETEQTTTLDSKDASIEEKRPPVPSAAPTPLPSLSGNIEFESVSFAYVGENWVLRDFSMKILAGEKIGIVGHTGAGKSTLISLLLRFYEPQKGRILLDGVDIRTIPLKTLRGYFGLIQQDVFLFSGTLAENLTFWRGDGLGALSERSRKILEEFQFQRPMDLVLEERGSNLSMGEKQVLSFVRAVESDPLIWLLDEPTASIDSSTEEKILRRLEVESRGKTFLMIAHRLATVKKLDRIFVLHKGELVESGSHEELLKKDGLYARFARYDRELSDQVSGE
jgi:ATP-binding cassette, subfamily B, multidrug efflux pump